MVEVRRLAFVPDLGEEESFVSFVDRAALDLGLNRTVMLQSFGLIRRHYDHLAGLGVDLTEDGYTAVARATGLPRDRIEGSLLARFRATAVDLTGLDLSAPASVQTWMSRSWAYIGKSSCCPACVRELGWWRVHWRTAWQFLCPLHERFLTITCPKCGQSLYSRPKVSGQVVTCCGPAATFPALRADGRPRVRRTGNDLCGQNIVDIPTDDVADRQLIDLQRTVLGLLDAQGDDAIRARALLAEMQSCMILAWYLGTTDVLKATDSVVIERFRVHCLERDDEAPRKGVEGPKYRAYGLTPSDPLLVAAAARIASGMVLSDDPRDAIDEFVGASYEQPALRDRWNQLMKFWTPPERLAPHFNRARAVRSFAVAANLDGRSSLASRSGHERLSWRHVPQLLWQESVDGVSGELFEHGWREHQRRFLALALARHLSPELSTWTKAAEALGLPGEVKANANRISSHLRQTDKGGILERFLVELTSTLEQFPEPIDYAHRRETLASLEDIDPQEWEAVVLSTGRKHVNRHWLARRREAAAWVWVTITGGDFHYAPSLKIDTLGPAERRLAENRYRAYFLQNALPEIEQALTGVAEGVLRDHGLRGPLHSPLAGSSRCSYLSTSSFLGPTIR